MHSLQSKEWGEKRMCEKILQTLQSVKEEKEQAMGAGIPIWTHQSRYPPCNHWRAPCQSRRIVLEGAAVHGEDSHRISRKTWGSSSSREEISISLCYPGSGRQLEEVGMKEAVWALVFCLCHHSILFLIGNNLILPKSSLFYPFCNWKWCPHLYLDPWAFSSFLPLSCWGSRPRKWLAAWQLAKFNPPHITLHFCGKLKMCTNRLYMGCTGWTFIM